MGRFERKPKDTNDYGYKLVPGDNSFSRWIIKHPSTVAEDRYFNRTKEESFSWKWTAKIRLRSLIKHARKEAERSNK